MIAKVRRRETAYRGGRPAPDLEGRTVVVVDDGLATGSTMRAAVTAVRAAQPAGVVAAAPIGAPDACEGLQSEVDDVVCVSTPRGFSAVGQAYVDFRPTSDDEVRRALAGSDG